MVGGPSDIEIVAALRAATPAARRELITAMDDLLADTDSLHARLVVPDRRPDGSLGFPYPKHSPALVRVCTALYAADVIVVFDWREWEGGNAYPGGAGLETATIADVARLLTFAVRSERFYDNALVDKLADGTFRAALHRLRAWYDSPEAGPLPAASLPVTRPTAPGGTYEHVFYFRTAFFAIYSWFFLITGGLLLLLVSASLALSLIPPASFPPGQTVQTVLLGLLGLATFCGGAGIRYAGRHGRTQMTPNGVTTRAILTTEYPWHTIESIRKIKRGLFWRVEVKTSGKPWMPLFGPRSRGPAPGPEFDAGLGLIESWWERYRHYPDGGRSEPEVTEILGRPVG
ncbi:hypothetical protein HGA13_16270 [Nocardia speluncae]|uniref:Uncharacterized protein n=1 Tax=Nocardia speluncae TaxID=419477 RepID=A0A846XGM0_9NOCA|nr:DUF6508 domain-containing protein [Nocardia speluncae]NKY34617.1 hypothetical protein [Nocardia speluncae]